MLVFTLTRISVLSKTLLKFPRSLKCLPKAACILSLSTAQRRAGGDSSLRGLLSTWLGSTAAPCKAAEGQTATAPLQRCSGSEEMSYNSPLSYSIYRGGL